MEKKYRSCKAKPTGSTESTEPHTAMSQKKKLEALKMKLVARGLEVTALKDKN